MGHRKSSKGRRKGPTDDARTDNGNKESSAAQKEETGQPERKEKDQYQHYIPRFILRNFALDDHLRHSRERHDIHVYSLAEGKLCIADIDTSYGLTNMYSDIQNIEDLNFVEKELSNLEQEASGILRQILDSGRKEITLTKNELSALKLFLWVMSFRNPKRRKQYADERFCKKGMTIQRQYMQERGRTSIGDVWLENMKGFLLDAQTEEMLRQSPFEFRHGQIGWMENSDQKLHDAQTFLCVWEAAEPYEFLLTDNGFTVFEGNCGIALPSFAYHYFYPVSPKRIIVACSVTFKQEDGLGLAMRETRKELAHLSPEDSIFSPEINVPPLPQYYRKTGIGRHSLFQDEFGNKIDVEKLNPKEKMEWEKSYEYAKYTYPVVMLGKGDVDKVNSCLLNEVFGFVTFRTPARMIRTIRKWRTYQQETGSYHKIFPPKGPPILGNSFEQAWRDVFDNLGEEAFLEDDITKLDKLETALMRDLNRTHPSYYNETVGKKSQNWHCDLTNQPAKLSWRRSGREMKRDGKEAR